MRQAHRSTRALSRVGGVHSPSVEETVEAAGTLDLIGAIAAAVLIAQAIWTAVRMTIARRIILKWRIGQLGPSAQVSFFTATLGRAPAISRSIEYRKLEYVDAWLAPDYDDSDEESPGDDERLVEVKSPGKEHFYVFPEAYIQVIANEDDSVLAYSVTSRRLWFRPRFRAPQHVSLRTRFRGLRLYRNWRWRPLLVVKLNRTTFGKVVDREDRDEPEYLRVPFVATTGARTWQFTDSYYLGNPGHYLTYVFTASSAVELRRLEFDALSTACRGLIDDEWPPARRAALKRFRDETRISTYTVIGPELTDDRYDWHFGPHGDEVRLLG